MITMEAAASDDVYRVLIVEDNRDMLMLISDLLRQMDIKSIYRAPNARRALRYLREDDLHFNLIICDWQLPGISGLELLRQVRRMDPDIPFMMLTVKSTRDDILQARDSGVTAYMTKPFVAADLMKRVAALSAA